MALKTRKPSGRTAWPLILVEGGEKTGKSYLAAAFTASQKIGRSYWIEFGAEGTADEYGQIPGTRYEIVIHDGSFAGLYQAVDDVRTEAHTAIESGEPPTVLVIDTITAEWDLLKDWATDRAKGSAANRKKLAADPHAEINVSTNYWNDANSRHRKLMSLLTTFPGIVILIARGKEVVAMDDNGRPIEGRRDYRVEGNKSLGYDVSCWVRLSREDRPLVVGMRSVHNGIRPGIDPPKPLPDTWNLEWLVFDLLRCDPATAQVRSVIEAKPERMPEAIRAEVISTATNFERLGELFAEAKQCGYESVTVSNERGQEEMLVDMIRRVGTERRAASPATPQQLRHLDSLFRKTDVFSDHNDRLHYVAETLGRDASPNDLTWAEAEAVAKRLASFIEQNTEPDEATEAGAA